MGALAGQLCSDVRAKDYKNNPKQFVRHLEIDTPFHCVHSKRNPFQCCQLKRILSNTSATFVYYTDTVYIGIILQFFSQPSDDQAPLIAAF